MKTVREFRTAGDFFFCECTFLPDDSSDVDEMEDLLIPCLKGSDVHLRMSFLIRYPKHVKKDSIFTRFACIAHPNLSPVIVAQEASRFLGLIKNMIDL